jgi:hypothetical protein
MYKSKERPSAVTERRTTSRMRMKGRDSAVGEVSGSVQEVENRAV